MTTREAANIIARFIIRERKQREYVFRFDPKKLAAKVDQCTSALDHLRYLEDGGPVPFAKSYHAIKKLIIGEHFWRGKIFTGKQREGKLAECHQAMTALEYLHEQYAPQPEAEQLLLVG